MDEAIVRKLLLIAYKTGWRDCIVGDDARSVDYQTEEEILLRIKSIDGSNPQAQKPTPEIAVAIAKEIWDNPVGNLTYDEMVARYATLFAKHIEPIIVQRDNLRRLLEQKIAEQ